MKIQLTLTNHKNTFFKQILKVIEECFEVIIALVFRHKTEKVVDELIDVSKTSLKAAKTLCNKKGIDFNKALTENHEKNEVRGYHK